jgi:hypothetical protein
MPRDVTRTTLSALFILFLSHSASFAQTQPCASPTPTIATQTDPSHETVSHRPSQETIPCGDDVATFGTTVVMPSGFRGEIYRIPNNTSKLPKFDKLKKIGTIYTNSFAVAPRDFKEGFPGVTDRLEWFAIDYIGKFWIEHPGNYRFILTSDDGAKLYIDDRVVLDNDGAHPPQAVDGSMRLEGGIHNLQLEYFQGRRFHVALMLEIAPEGENPRIFSTEEFKPPPNPEDWHFANPTTPTAQ